MQHKQYFFVFMPAGNVDTWLDWHWLNHSLGQNLWYFVLSVSLNCENLCVRLASIIFFWEIFLIHLQHCQLFKVHVCLYTQPLVECCRRELRTNSLPSTEVPEHPFCSRNAVTLSVQSFYWILRKTSSKLIYVCTNLFYTIQNVLEKDIYPKCASRKNQNIQEASMVDAKKS